MKGIMRTSGERHFRSRLKIKITLVESTYPSQRPQCPSLSPHFLLNCAMKRHLPKPISLYAIRYIRLWHSISTQFDFLLIRALAVAPDSSSSMHVVSSQTGLMQHHETLTMQTWRLPEFCNWSYPPFAHISWAMKDIYSRNYFPISHTSPPNTGLTEIAQKMVCIWLLIV